MKIKLVILLLILSFKGFSQDPLMTDTTKAKIIHISTHGYFIQGDKQFYDQSIHTDTSNSVLTAYEAKQLNLDSTALITLSLVDRDSSITRNWNEFKEKYKDRNYLIVVSNSDDGSKGDFVIYFYEQWYKGKSIKQSYELTVREFERKYPNLKHHLNIIKE